MAKAIIPPDIRWEVWERDNFTCRHCGVRRHLSVDHIIAESKGGPMTLDNLQTLCRSCNSRKGAGPVVAQPKVKRINPPRAYSRRQPPSRGTFEGDRCLLIHEVAEQMGESENQVRHRLESGEIRSIRVYKRGGWRVWSNDLDDYLAARAQREEIAS